MEWTVLLHPEFDPEFAELPEAAQDELAALSQLLKHFGPQLSRPHADTLNGSKHANMKELRFDAADGAWRVAFAFDPKRAAILLVVGDKSGTNEKRFYRKLIEKADRRFDAHLAALKEGKMPRTIDDLMKSWPASRRAKVDARAKDLAAEYRTLQDLRKAQDLTQERIAEILGIKQANVSRLEKRSDLLLSTLRSYVAAMGGDLELVARFPDRPPVILSGLRNMEKASPAGRPRRAQAAHGSRKPARRPSAASH